ncbi:hypothetical protein PTSG_02027 [Salpingoeca rosetta]|uniref:Fibrinogen C-terminal domain-containing protein n=1 Tax=Salpingoeca rosetta (strain ATCC 50818 / BSB-021) TaxID=946362 RepID=F2TZN5_SALR5|nr:uncharacterized protein PTSG_02027 [Salpingoeca rosetta]EGD79059.1 hypothetical protein PTSG_02027 [Salpingoeca rosetta]|eukprot:XP_004998015.1 hypothetical protein PTSG_02027 [Salpingoeca rosetta]
MCDGSEFVSITTRGCEAQDRGHSQDCAAPSCASIKKVSPDASSGMYYVGTVEPVPLVYCDMRNKISRGGNGTRSNPGSDCFTLKSLFNMPTGTYWLDTPTGLVQAYCDMDTDGGGWQLVWLHEYLHTLSPGGDMAFYSQASQPCTGLDLSWCNTPSKTQQRAVEQMTAAYHNGALQYAYKAHFNGLLDTDYLGGILHSPSTKLVDRCTSGNGIPPEPVSPDQTDYAIGGITFDKANAQKYNGNCDTDRYRQSSGQDCRWENCAPPTGNHNQMTLAIFIR